MHEPAGVVEILVQILQNTPILKYGFRIPPPPKMKIVRDLGTLTFQFQNTPLPLKMKIVRDLGTLTFQFQNTPPAPPLPENLNLVRSWHFKTFQFQNNWYEWQTMCGKLPHVETLSSPDNYSFQL